MILTLDAHVVGATNLDIALIGYPSYAFNDLLSRPLLTNHRYPSVDSTPQFERHMSHGCIFAAHAPEQVCSAKEKACDSSSNASPHRVRLPDYSRAPRHQTYPRNVAEYHHASGCKCFQNGAAKGLDHSWMWKVNIEVNLEQEAPDAHLVIIVYKPVSGSSGFASSACALFAPPMIRTSTGVESG